MSSGLHGVPSPIAYMDVRFSVHATEDMEKVKKAVYNLFPPTRSEEIAFKKDAVKGHYGNPIVLFMMRTKNEELIKALVKKVASGLGPYDKEEISQECQRFPDKSNLYLRLDKQAAFKDELRLRRADPIHICLHFKKKNIVESCRELGIVQ
jgi:RNA binding exosome subunit